GSIMGMLGGGGGGGSKSNGTKDMSDNVPFAFKGEVAKKVNKNADEPFKTAAKVAQGYGHILESGYGVPKDALATMSLGEKRGLVRRMEMQSFQQEQQQNMAARAQRMAVEAQQLETAKQQFGANKALQGFG